MIDKNSCPRSYVSLSWSFTKNYEPGEVLLQTCHSRANDVKTRLRRDTITDRINILDAEKVPNSSGIVGECQLWELQLRNVTTGMYCQEEKGESTQSTPPPGERATLWLEFLNVSIDYSCCGKLRLEPTHWMDAPLMWANRRRDSPNAFLILKSQFGGNRLGRAIGSIFDWDGVYQRHDICTFQRLTLRLINMPPLSPSISLNCQDC